MLLVFFSWERVRQNAVYLFLMGSNELFNWWNLSSYFCASPAELMTTNKLYPNADLKIAKYAKQEAALIKAGFHGFGYGVQLLQSLISLEL